MYTILSAINWPGLLVGAVAAYLLGALWYSPKLFGKAWMEAQPHRSPEDYKNSGIAMTFQAIATLLLAVMIGIFLAATESFLLTIVVIGLTFTALSYSHSRFQGQKLTLWLIDNGYRLAMILLIAIAVALIG